MTTGAPPFDRARAHALLDRSRFKFIRDVSAWLKTFDDSVDVLFALSGDVGQKFGPWETYRWCAVLGAATSSAVISLGHDVLSETPPASSAPPISSAFAVAHAHELLAPAGAEREQPSLFLAALARATTSPPQEALAVQCARLALGDDAVVISPAVVVSEQMASLATLVLEAALGRGPAAEPLASAAIASLGQFQTEEGGAAAGATHAFLRELTTVRALALLARHDAYGVAALRPLVTRAP